jgi:hypothetical protein
MLSIPPCFADMIEVREYKDADEAVKAVGLAE